MPNRLDIELTSARDDGSFTWRAAGAKEPRGVVDGSILPGGVSVGDQLKVEADYGVDGISILAVVPPKEKPNRDLLEMLPVETDFEPVVEQRARPSADDRGDRRRPRRDDRRGERRESRHGDDRPPRRRREGGGGDDRGAQRQAADRGGGRGEPRGRRREFTPPPEVPQRPKPKRLRPGKTHRNDVLGALPESQRPIAELVLQGMPAVRQRLRDDNAELRAEGKPEMPEDSVLAMAEDLLPRLRVADWLDRADAAKRQMEHLDLRDLRSVVASSDDPIVARDESTRDLAAEMKAALASKQEAELALWLTDVAAALDVGRVIRALRLSSQPPKAGVPFPTELATRLAEATNASLLPHDGTDRWSAVLEAAAFSPIRAQVLPAEVPSQVPDDLRRTVTRLAPLLPQVAGKFGVEVPTGAPAPKPLRPTRPPKRPKSAQPAKPVESS
jgi:hypothetical protein